MYSTDRIEAILKENEYFRGLDPKALRILAEICLVKSYLKNETLFTEGQAGFACFLLLSGTVRVTRTSEEGRETVIKLLKPGELFGEVVLFERKEYPARAEAAAPSEALVIPKKQIDCLLEQPSFRRAFIGLLFGKLRYLTDRLLSVTADDVEERFFGFLTEHYGMREEHRIALSKKDIAAAIGANPETFSRLIARLRRAGRIEWRGKLLRMKKPPGTD